MADALVSSLIHFTKDCIDIFFGMYAILVHSESLFQSNYASLITHAYNWFHGLALAILAKIRV